MKQVVKLNSRNLSYPIVIDNGIFNLAPLYFNKDEISQKGVIITDENVEKLYGIKLKKNI